MSTPHRYGASCWTVICLLVLLVGCVLSLPVGEEDIRVEKPLGGVPDGGSVHEEVVVAAALYVHKKAPTTPRRQRREIRSNSHTSQSASDTNRFDMPGKREPNFGKQHDKDRTNWKPTPVTSKVGHRKE
uniref:Secreted protein n=1 Tax=Anopheles epiroticus TaxID=199890 RepID=A0A3F2YWM2_9DIPT